MAARSSSEGVVLITGGNSGIGFEAARRLAELGRRLILASRNLELTEAAATRICKETPGAEIEALALDLASQDSVRQFAKEIDARDVPLRALVCNAGLQMNSGPQLSPDGVELTIAVNHLGHFLLTNLLLRRLVAHAPSRVVVVASGVHDPDLFTGMPKADVREMDVLFATGGADPSTYSGLLAYVNSKLCNLWFTYELARRIQASGIASSARPLSVNAYEPGLVPGSGLGRDYPTPLRWIWEGLGPGLGRLLSPLVAGINTAPQSGRALADVVLDPTLERNSGKYFPSHTRFREAPSSKASYDEARAAELWEASVRSVGLSAAESPLVT